MNIHGAWFASSAMLVLGCTAALWPTAAKAQEPAGRESTLLVVTPAHAAAVERGLCWLNVNQSEDGSWQAKIGFNLITDYR
jgi:hypothetical protein